MQNRFQRISVSGLAPCVSVVVHDVAPSLWPACMRLLHAIEQIGTVPLSLLAVPRYHGQVRDSMFEHWLATREALGDEIVLHGYTHRDEGTPSGPHDRWRRTIYTRGEGEFSDLCKDDALQRLKMGMGWLADIGIVPDGFVAPAWLASDGTWDALHHTSLRYSCTLNRLVLLQRAQAAFCQAQVWSDQTIWRRRVSLIWNAALAVSQSRHPILRLELHPTDADHPSTRRSWQTLLRTALCQRRQALTLSQLCSQIALYTGSMSSPAA